MLGKYKSLSITLASSIKHPVDIAITLDKTKLGACWICMKSQTSNTCGDIPFSEVLSNQRTYSMEVINKLYEYFHPVLKESSSGINLSVQNRHML